ncbi:hypothetical protein XELAEV_18007477mg [Xenopus laevis]|uniref:Uncharacterized protein n=1 Tax=Xenopus laevis TaxID=8355 RepID=A0A974E2Y9_XENLA|nr:hypothetical protein XELAEV_18007477mg [Xenopus laevis]
MSWWLVSSTSTLESQAEIRYNTTNLLHSLGLTNRAPAHWGVGKGTWGLCIRVKSKAKICKMFTSPLSMTSVGLGHQGPT